MAVDDRPRNHLFMFLQLFLFETYFFGGFFTSKTSYYSLLFHRVFITFPDCPVLFHFL